MRIAATSRTARRRPRLRRRGMVFVVVLWIALGLVSLALYFGQAARWAAEASENSLAGQQAEQAIDGARRYITFVLDNFITPGERPDPDAGDYRCEGIPVDQSRFWILGRDPNLETPPTTPVYGLVDEASKLNLNNATLEMLEALPNMTSPIAAAIIDWRDSDSDLTPDGAESADYEALDTPYAAKNGDFESVAELRLVKGIDLRTLWGEDVNNNDILDPNENDGNATWPDDNADGRLDPGLAEYVTVWTREPNTRTDGTAKHNIQSITRRELTELLEGILGAARAGEVMRSFQDPVLRFGSPLEFYRRSGLTTDEYAKMEDALTVGSGSYRVGLVNVCTASATVLACLPGMDESKAKALVAQRQKLDTTQLQSLAWVGQVLDDLAIVRQVGPYLTARSYQFSADIVAVGANGRGLRRSFMVFNHEDATRVIYRRDCTRMGWPLGTTQRNMSDTPLKMSVAKSGTR